MVARTKNRQTYRGHKKKQQGSGRVSRVERLPCRSGGYRGRPEPSMRDQENDRRPQNQRVCNALALNGKVGDENMRIHIPCKKDELKEYEAD